MDSAVLLRSGNPAVYKLKTNTEMFGTLTTVTLGKKDTNKSNKTILLIGETGSGKSTLINALVNYTMGVKFEEKVWYQIVEVEGQTSDVIVYQIFGYEGKTLPFSLTIIDTPSFGDNRGLDNDVIISQRLFDLFRSEDGVHELHAVGLVMKAMENQMHIRLRCVFDSVLSLFGKDLQQSTVALITNSDGTPPVNVFQALEAAEMECVKNNSNHPVHFMFNNRQNESRTKETTSGLQDAWTVAEKGMRQLTDFLQKMSAKPVQAMSGFNSYIRLSASIQNLQDRIKFNELKQTEIKQVQESLGMHDNEMKKNTTVEIDEVYKDKEQIKGEMEFLKTAVCCTVCEENCHYPGCTMALVPEHCEVMQLGCCTVCTNKCPASAHVKDSWKYVTKTRKVQKTKEVNIKTFEKNKTDTKQVQTSEMEEEMERLNLKKSQLIEESYQHAVKLDKTGFKVNSLSTYVPLDFLIEKMKEKGDTKKLQKLEDIDSQLDEGAKAVLQSRSNITSSQQLISNSILIRPGCPAIYQLKTTKEARTVTRVTFGKKKLNKPNKTILLVGESGVGKSTLINTMVNYTMGVKFEDDVWYQIVEDENRSQAESQTSDVIVYQIFGFEGKTLPFSLTIIDTPGYGDTRGIDRDVVVSERLFDLFRSEDGVHEVHAVGLVMKASVNRLSDRLMYIFDSVMSLFGKDIENNIVTLVTHSNGRAPKDLFQALETASIKCAKNETKQPVYFMFNNSQHEDRTEDAELLETTNMITMRGMSQFTSFLEKTAPKKLETTLDVMNERIRLIACIQNLQERIKLTEFKEIEIKQIKEALSKPENERKNENITVEFDEVCKDKESVDDSSVLLMTLVKAAVCCTVCEENCHYPGCTTAQSPKDCEVMKDGYCTVCTMKCPVSAHVKGKWRYVTKTRKVLKSLEEIKKRSTRDKKMNFLCSLESEMKNLAEEKSSLLDESVKHVVNLEQIALKVNTLSMFDHLEFLIEKMEDNGDMMNVQKLEEMKKRMKGTDQCFILC